MLALEVQFYTGRNDVSHLDCLMPVFGDAGEGLGLNFADDEVLI